MLFIIEEKSKIEISKIVTTNRWKEILEIIIIHIATLSFDKVNTSPLKLNLFHLPQAFVYNIWYFKILLPLLCILCVFRMWANTTLHDLMSIICASYFDVVAILMLLLSLVIHIQPTIYTNSVVGYSLFSSVHFTINMTLEYFASTQNFHNKESRARKKIIM